LTATMAATRAGAILEDDALRHDASFLSLYRAPVILIARIRDGRT
jgi:hypothetical protein